MQTNTQREVGSVAADLRAARALNESLGLPTLEQAAEAASVLLLCNGNDIDVWTAGYWPDDNATEALRQIVLSLVNGRTAEAAQ